MYNGIGLQTARGSGTNGYVQRNLSAVRKHSDRVDYKSEEELKKLEQQFNKRPNKEILEHDRKRQVEVKCMEMQDLMEEQGYPQEEIEAKVTQFRKLLMEKEAVSDSVTVLKDDFGRPIATETHQIALATEEKNARWRKAFGIEAREDEKRSFGEEMEKRWQREEMEEEKNREEEVRRKEKKKKHRRDPSEERDEKRKHKRDQSEERDDRKKPRQDQSEERDERRKHRHNKSEENEDKRKLRKRHSRSKSPESPHKKDRHRRSRSPRSPANSRRPEDSPKRSRRRSGSPETVLGRPRKKR